MNTAKPPPPARDAESEKDRLDARLDEALEETFPASDPVAVSPREAGAEPSTPEAPGYVLRDNAALNRFELDLQGHTAVATYDLSPGVITILHTEVPSDMEGHGIGSAFTRLVLEEARRRGLKVVPRCPFTRAFIAKHQEFADLLA